MESLTKTPTIEAYDDGIEIAVGFTKDLVTTRSKELHAFAIALRNDALLAHVCTQPGDAAFKDVIGLAVQDYGVGQKELAAAIGVSPATVSRWIGGSSLPAPYARKGILDAISILVEYDLDL